MTWAEANLLSLKAEYIQGTLNVRADWLSRQTLQEAEWALNPRTFSEISRRFGKPLVDLFATDRNRQVPRFFSRYPHPEAEATNALVTIWPKELLYAFPPLPLLPRVLRRIQTLQAEVILVAPKWPRRPWFSTLVQLSCQPHLVLPVSPDLLAQGPIWHPDPAWWHLTVWRLSGKP